MVPTACRTTITAGAIPSRSRRHRARPAWPASITAGTCGPSSRGEHRMPGDQGEHVDVQELMREVQRRARTSPDGERPMEPPQPPEHSLRGHYDLLATPLDSPRPGFGQVLKGIRRALTRLLFPVFHRQTAFNVAVVAGMDQAAARAKRVESEIGMLERQVATQMALAERVGHLSARVRRLEAEVTQPAHAQEPLAEPGGQAGVPARAGKPAFIDQVSMQERFRGSQEEVKDRQRKYVQYFRAGGRVLDIGCGRGEFLELLREQGVSGQGVDYDLDNVLHCQSKGLDVAHGDAFALLEQLPDGALDGIFCAQFIEHFPPPQIVRLVNLVARKLAPNGVAIFETPNPACLSVFAHAYYLDFTHVWPYHPEVMTFLMQAAGFMGVRLVFSSPLDPDARFPLLSESAVFGGETEMYNRAAALVNRLLFGPQDYAVIGRKPADTS